MTNSKHLAACLATARVVHPQRLYSNREPSLRLVYTEGLFTARELN